MLMYMIYSFSAQPGEVSSEMSYKVSYKLVQTADYVFDGGHEDWQLSQWAGKINFITRKLAHMTEYFLLAIAVSFPLYVYGLHGFLLMLTAGIICVGFACGDEYHQSFISGRSPAVKDVCIDSFGVFWGIILVRIIGWTGRKTIFRPRPEKKHFKRKNAAACAYEYEQGPAWEEAPVRPKKKRFGRKTIHIGEPQGGYPSENDYGPQDNYYDPENSFQPQDDYCNPDRAAITGRGMVITTRATTTDHRMAITTRTTTASHRMAITTRTTTASRRMAITTRTTASAHKMILLPVTVRKFP